MIFIITMLGLVLVSIIISVIRRHAAQTTTNQLIMSSQLPTNQAMRYAQVTLPELFDQSQPISSTLVANVWGHGVMAFEFVFDDLRMANQVTAMTELEVTLNQFATQNNLIGYQGLVKPFKVTDFWQALDDHKWHIDITYIVNQVTLEYTHDIEKLNTRA
ncbi:hypothetical protein KAR50_01315 [Periweissella fabaria]|uniref:Uncharacterized protein n=1 Tax=Periweissella fabaria TaxID=546157 RepID=A0ABM8Z3H3_9LACO|nr:hypothetical protein [Periweissella fabaria]MCM0596485.1 hypothetical protein [Periweissella fabaria]CAH0415786.1 hypothetical protein WFA24289_00084 [Periweissella fabaria]